MATSKTCFVTFGATAAFSDLLRAVLEPRFVSALSQHGYTDLIISYGAEGKILYDQLLNSAHAESDAVNMNISGFGLDPAGLKKYMVLAKGQGRQSEGLVICHAGA